MGRNFLEGKNTALRSKIVPDIANGVERCLSDLIFKGVQHAGNTMT